MRLRSVSESTVIQLRGKRVDRTNCLSFFRVGLCDLAADEVKVRHANGRFM